VFFLAVSAISTDKTFATALQSADPAATLQRLLLRHWGYILSGFCSAFPMPLRKRSAAASWPLAARGQPRERMRRIGVLMTVPAEDQNGRDRVAVFRQALQGRGWIEGVNVRIDIRATGDQGLLRRYAAELVALTPQRGVAAGYRHGSHRICLNRETQWAPALLKALADPAATRRGLVTSNLTSARNIWSC
jgi:hypothetical protein